MAKIKKLTVLSAGKDAKKRELLCTAVGDVKWCDHVGQ
jgi:hypothetical protein